MQAPNFPALVAVVLCVHACGNPADEGRDAGQSAGDAGALDADAEPQLDSGRDAAEPLDAAASSDDAAADEPLPVSDSDPLTTTVDAWAFLPIDGARCGNGTATGVGVNRSTQSADLVILMEGGGACWDGESCFERMAAVHVEDTYDAALFQSEFVSTQGPTTRDPNNPLSVATQVFVPYCTGDLHAGRTVRSYDVNGTARTVHHVGALNMQATLARLRAGLPTPSTIWFIGGSAGGYGSTLNLQAVERMFPEATVHMMADSSPLLTPPAERWESWKTAWDLRFPEACTDCPTRFGALVDALAEDDRHGRIGLIASYEDAVIGAYYGLDGPTERAQLEVLLGESYGHADTRYFVANGTGHSLLATPSITSATTGVALQTWFVSWAVGLPAWSNAP